jgi:hypothetical protein
MPLPTVACQCLDAVPAGHREVEQDRVVVPRRDLLERRLAVRSGIHSHSAHLEPFRQSGGELLFVVD